MPETQHRERLPRGDEPGPRIRPASGIQRLPAEARLAATRKASILDDPDLIGNPVALAHARAADHENHRTTSGTGRPIGGALALLLVVPTIVVLVSNPLGWLALFGLCLGFAYLIGFGGIL